ncbi:MAG: DUF4214 domain-containing protein [Telluria sp.]
MPIRLFVLAICLTSLLAACGGGDPRPLPAGTRLLATSSATAPVSFSGVIADYTVAPTTDGYTVTALTNGAVANVPRNARIRFADTSVGLDLDGASGQAYRLYRAAFDRVPDGAGVGFWIAAMDQGVGLDAIADAFVESAEFKAVYGANPTNASYVDGLYQHVLHRPGDPAGIAYWTGVLDRAAANRVQVLAAFGESAEARGAVQEETRTGITYLESGIDYVPAAHPGATRFVDVNSAVTVDGSASTVAVGKNILYYWTLAQVPPGSKAVLANAGTARPSFTADIEGKYVLKLVVSDGIKYSREVSTTVLALWRPAEGQVPATGDALYVKVDPGLLYNLSGTYLYTKAVAQFQPPVAGSYQLNVAGDISWAGWFQLPQAALTLTKGYYAEFSTVQSQAGALTWTAGGNYCAGSGWFVVDDATYQDGELTALTIRFEQHCSINEAAVRGLYRWTKADLSTPPGPVFPVPTGLWKPPAGSVPSAGNYVYLEGEAGDLLGGGKQSLYTSANSTIGVRSFGNYAEVGVAGPTSSYFSGTAAPMYNLGHLAPGYYPGVLRYPFNNPAKGGMDWNVGSTGCNTLNGWFVVDKVTYDGDRITALDLRFEQHCEQLVPALHGQVHWVAGS